MVKVILFILAILTEIAGFTAALFSYETHSLTWLAATIILWCGAVLFFGLWEEIKKNDSKKTA